MKDYVEYECPLAWKHEESIEIQELYDWWVNKRSNRGDSYNFVDDNLSYEEYIEKCRIAVKTELEYQEEDQQMLHKLIDVRLSLWT